MSKTGIAATVAARIICWIALFSVACLLTSPALAIADSSVHGIVYDWSTFNTMSNAVVEVYSIPDQTFIERAVIKSGSYTFSLPGGTYRLDAKAGTAGTQNELVATENITVLDSGDYVIDLILFPPMGLDDLEAMNESENLNETLPEQEMQPTALPSAAGNQNDLILFGLVGIGITLAVLLTGFLILRIWKPRIPQEKIERVSQAEHMEETAETTDVLVPEEAGKDKPSSTPQESQPMQPASVQSQLLPQDCREVLAIIEKNGGRITQLDLRRLLPYSEAKVSLIISDLESRGLLKKIKKGRGNVLILNRDDEKPQ